jgi:hypothetical protein
VRDFDAVRAVDRDLARPGADGEQFQAEIWLIEEIAKGESRARPVCSDTENGCTPLEFF